MSYESDLDDLMRERKARQSGETTPSGNGVAIGKIDVKHIAVPANKVIRLPDGTVIVREKGSDT